MVLPNGRRLDSGGAGLVQQLRCRCGYAGSAGLCEGTNRTLLCDNEVSVMHLDKSFRGRTGGLHALSLWLRRLGIETLFMTGQKTDDLWKPEGRRCFI
jgi:hypothetical protein